MMQGMPSRVREVHGIWLLRAGAMGVGWGLGAAAEAAERASLSLGQWGELRPRQEQLQCFKNSYVSS